MRWSRARHPRMTRNRSGHSRRLRVGDGMRSPSVWHFVKRFAPCPSGALAGQNCHRTVPFHLHPLRRTSQCNQHPGCATLYLDCSAAGEDLFDTARRRLEVGDRNAERPRPARRNRRPAKAPAVSPAPLLSLLSDALSLFEAEYARNNDNRRRRCPGEAGG